MTRAAEALRIAQPALSRQITQLEAYFNVKLLTRTKRGVAPTAAGELLYRHASLILRQLKVATGELQHADVEIKAVVRIGLPGSLVHFLAVPLLKKVRALHPGICLEVMAGSYQLMSEMAVSGRIDLVLSSAGPVHGIRSELLLTDEVVLISRADLVTEPHGSQVAIADLVGHPLIIPTHLLARHSSVHEAFFSHGLTPTIVAELASPQDMIAAVREGFGSATLGRITAEHFAKDLIVRRLIDPVVRRPIYLSEPESLPTLGALAVKSLLLDLIDGMVERGDWPCATVAR